MATRVAAMALVESLPAEGSATGERSPFVQSLVRALGLLNIIAEAPGGITLSEIAQKVGLPASTAHRLLTTLEQERYVRFDPAARLWSIGVQAFVTGTAFVRARDVVDLARPRLRRLMRDSGETANLAIEQDGEGVYLAQVECRQTMRALAPPGARVPLHCSAVGKALLAAMPEGRALAILRRRGLPRFTVTTLVTLPALQGDLERTSRRCYAVDDEEHAPGLRCVASVIYDEHGEPVGAISLAGPVARVTDDRLPLLGDLVRRAAREITRDFGGRPPAEGRAGV